MQRSQKWQQEIEKASAFITNISNYALTDQIIALSKGLGFIPTPADKPCKISLICDNHNLKRTMRIRHHAAEKPKSTAIPLVFKTKYNPHFAGKYIGQALLKHWNIIEKNVRLFPKPPMIAYSRSENLRDSLVRLNSPPGRRMTTRILWEIRKIHHPHQPCTHFKIWIWGTKVSTCS